MYYLFKFHNPNNPTAIIVKYRGKEHYKSVAELFRMARAKGYRIQTLTVWENKQNDEHRTRQRNAGTDQQNRFGQ